ncbi:MAG: exodeoxyribonuclease III, partial [Patescibacteria group bacterium]|nr:exodeoxyribonuclease III [Patescibacteria group bacterium]
MKEKAIKIISWNVNGLRSVYRKNFLQWVKEEKPDIICLQETKIQPQQILPGLIEPPGYLAFFNSASKKGYAGVGIFTKTKPLSKKVKMGMEKFDREGRILRLDYPNFILINIYFPHGGRQKENLNYKLEAYEYFLKYLEKIKNGKVILVGGGFKALNPLFAA